MPNRHLPSLAAVLIAAGGLLVVHGQPASRPASAAVRENAYRQNNIGVARLEQYDYPGGADAFRRALELDADLAMARLNLAIALLYDGRTADAAAAARAAAAAMPGSPRPAYVAGLIARADNRPDDAAAAFRQVLEIDPADVGSRIQLGQLELAARRYAEAARLFGEALTAEPFNATAAYGRAVALTRAGQREAGEAAMALFQSLRDNPAAVTYSSTYLEQGRHGEALPSTGLESDVVDTSIPEVAYADATAAILPERVTPGAPLLADIDTDGDLELLVSSAAGHVILRNDGGRFAPPVSVGAGGSIGGLLAADYDNDGHPDLLLAAGPLRLLRGGARGVFEDVTGEAGILKEAGGASAAAFADIDHDGDLDALAGAVLRNNGNGTFADVTRETRIDGLRTAIAIVPTDYDNRRDVDLLVLPSSGRPALYANRRDGTFADVAADVGLPGEGAYTGMAAADVNKDGFVDFLFARRDAPAVLAMSQGGPRYAAGTGPDGTESASAAHFIDYDNDGLLDLLALTPAGPRLWRHVGTGWTDVTARALPGGLAPRGDPPQALASGDLDGDGDTDVVVRLSSGGLRAWRNEGGERQASLAVRLASRVSNRSAAGSKVELRAGSLRARLETSIAWPPAGPADLVFGLGRRQQADAVRVLWPAGILQAETELPASQPPKTHAVLTLTELDRKPSSCPYLYTWNGRRFEFVTDFMGGGEMGYWVAPGVRNVPDPDEYVRIGSDTLQERAGVYELRVTNELEEALFIDRLELVAVDHPADVGVYPNEGLFSPAARRPFMLHTVRAPRPPVSAIDHHGHDVLDRVRARDRRFVDDFRLAPIQGYAEEHSLTLDVGPRPAGGRMQLLLTGWTDYAFSSDNVAAHQAGLEFRPPQLQVRQADGSWRTALTEVGLPVGRPQTVPVDLSPVLRPGERVVRIVTTLRVYWDQVLVDVSAPANYTVARIDAREAKLRWRGFSAEVSPDGGPPFTYDYDRVSPESPWKTMRGRYTREGDVRTLLAAVDDMFVVSAPGDELALSFDAAALPETPRGWTRTFLLYVDGFSKEMNLHSSSPDALEPFPFHGMSGYPYPTPEKYPDTPAHRRYRAEFNTRVIGGPLPPLEAAAPAAAAPGARKATR